MIRFHAEPYNLKRASITIVLTGENHTAVLVQTDFSNPKAQIVEQHAKRVNVDRKVDLGITLAWQVLSDLI